jgi:chemotaxis family two-component system response regulator Rcp1
MNSGIGDQPLQILIAEDNPGDVRLAEEIIAKSSQPANISVAEDGEQALAMLKKEGEYSETPCPDLILLDLKLPKVDGTEVLAQINSDPDLVTIPVMIVTGSEAESSLLEAYHIPPSRYTRKPIQLNVFNRMVDQLGHFSRQPILIPSDNERQDLEMAGGGKRWWWPFN